MRAIDKASSVRPDEQPTNVLLLGATLSNRNLGVCTLAAGALQCIFTCFPRASVSILDYAVDPSADSASYDDRQVSIPVINMRFSKALYRPNNIAFLLVYAWILRLLPLGGLRDRLLSFNRCLRQVNTAQIAAAISGGDSFSDIYGMKRFFYCALPQILILLLNKRLVLLPQTYGPFRSRLSKVIAGSILRKVERAYARDKRSLTVVETLLKLDFADDRYLPAYDLGFAVGPAAPSEIEIEGISFPGARMGQTLIGLNVSGLLYMGGYNHGNMFSLSSDYPGLIKELVNLFMKKENTQVLLTPHVFGDEAENDLSACEKVYADLKPLYGERLGLLRGEVDQGQIKYVIGRCDFFVGSRMHACIAAFSQCIPCVPIAYSDKFIGVMEIVGIDSAEGIGLMIADARSQSLFEIVTIVDKCYEHRGVIRDILTRTMPHVRQSAARILTSRAAQEGEHEVRREHPCYDIHPYPIQGLRKE